MEAFRCLLEVESVERVFRAVHCWVLELLRVARVEKRSRFIIWELEYSKI